MATFTAPSSTKDIYLRLLFIIVDEHDMLREQRDDDKLPIQHLV